MPLTLPNLDDRTYQDLVDEARSLIPAYAPEWTNHNASDPGIALIELFAWIAETLNYRVNRVTDANLTAFLKLLNGADWTPVPGQPLAAQIRDTILELRTPQRAVTEHDFEALAKMADPKVKRVHALARRNLAADTPEARAADAPAHVSVIVIPDADVSNPRPQPDAALLQTVSGYLDPRRLLTTVVNVLGPRYLGVHVQATLVPATGAVAADVTARATNALLALTHPLLGGADGQGWPFGRGIYASDIYQSLEALAGVDYVDDGLVLTADDAARTGKSADGSPRILAMADELVVIADAKFTLVTAGGGKV